MLYPSSWVSTTILCRQKQNRLFVVLLFSYSDTISYIKESGDFKKCLSFRVRISHLLLGVFFYIGEHNRFLRDLRWIKDVGFSCSSVYTATQRWGLSKRCSYIPNILSVRGVNVWARHPAKMGVSSYISYMLT